MARLTDHDRRDAEHALRAEIALIQGRYTRRLYEAGKARIEEEFNRLLKEGRDIDGLTTGRAAAQAVASQFFPNAAPKTAIAITASGADSEPEKE